MILNTKRLILRKPKKRDWKDIQDAMEDGSIARNTATIPYPYKKKDALWFVNDSTKKWRKKEKKNFPFFIELKRERKIIGVLSLFKIDKPNGTAETGSWMNPKYRKKGYITEAKIAVNELAFNKFKLRKLETEVFVNNKASNATQRGVGYRYEGRRIKSKKCVSTGKVHDIELYGLLREDWKKNLPKLKRHLINKISKEKH